MKKFICAECDKYIYARDKYDEALQSFVAEWGVDFDEYDDSDDVCVIARCRECQRKIMKEIQANFR